VFVKIATRLLLALAVGAIVVAALAAASARTINNSGGWGWLLIIAVFIAVATVVCLASAVCAGISLLKKEARARLAKIILVACSLEVWLFGGSLMLFVRAFEKDPNVAIVRAEAELAGALVQHFADANVVLKPGGREGGFQAGWFIEDPALGPRCSVTVRFRHFAHDTPVEMMRKAVEGMIPPPVLNEGAALAMYRPAASGRSAAASDCDAWSERSAEITERIRAAFQTFDPPAAEIQ
jgi:hypothetical protein